MEPWERADAPDPSGRAVLLQLCLVVVAAGGFAAGLLVAMVALFFGPLSPFFGLGTGGWYVATLGVGAAALLLLAALRGVTRRGSNR